jgi:hypothetical protein
MSDRRKHVAKLVSLPVLALCGFVIAAMLATAGLGTVTTTTTTTTVVEFEGCTPGFWKNLEQHGDEWTGFTPGQSLESVFDVPDALGLDNVTLHEALSFGGGPGTLGGAEILLRAGVAALLNSAHPDVDYPLSTAEVIADVNAALASLDRDTMIDLAADLDADNNLGCPL